MKFLQLVIKNRECKAGIQFRVVELSLLDSAIFIVFDQTVVGISGKRQWAESQCIYNRKIEQSQIWFCCLERQPFSANGFVTTFKVLYNEPIDTVDR